MAYQKRRLLVTIPILTFITPFYLIIKGMRIIFEYLEVKFDDLSHELDIWAANR